MQRVIKWVCCLGCLVVLVLAVVRAEDAPKPPDEKRSLNLAKRSFQDGLYEIAEARLLEFIQTFPQSKEIDEVRWLYGQALYFKNKYEDALKIFQKPPQEGSATLRAGFQFWKAETLVALQRWTEAEKEYFNFIAAYPQDERLPSARLSLSHVLFQQNKTEDALNLLRELQTLGPKNPTSQRAILLRAKIVLAQNKFSEMRELLTPLLNQKLSPPIQTEVNYWLGEVAWQEKKTDEALGFYNKITADTRATPQDLVAKTWLRVGQIMQSKANWEAAIQAFEKSSNLSRDEATTQSAIQAFLESNRQVRSLSSAALKIREFVNQQNQPLGLLLLAQAFQQDGNLDAAIAELDRLVQNYADSKWATDGRFLMAELLLKKGEMESATQTYQKIISQNKNPERVVDSLFRLADILVQNSKFEEAAKLYEKIASSKVDSEKKEQGLLNAAATWAQADRLEDFLKIEEKFSKEFSKNDNFKKLMLEKSRLLSRVGKNVEARQVLQDLLKLDNKSDEAVQALFILGMSFFRDVDYPSAITQFQKLITEFPQNENVRPAIYQRILAQLRNKELTPEIAQAQYRELLLQKSDDAVAPQIAFQIAQLAYEQQNFGDAQESFLKFVEKYPKHSLAQEALYFAGRAFMSLGNYDQAIQVFENMKDDSVLKIDSRLSEIDCYRALGNFKAALKIANTLDLKSDQPLRAEWLLKRASLLYTIADQDVSVYREAVEASRQVINTPAANLAQRNEAGFILGKSFEKLNQPDEALQSYMDVIYNKLLPDTQVLKQPESLWLTRCGIEAARMKEEKKDIQGAIAIYRIMERLSGANREQFTQKIDELRTRYFIWEE